MSKELSEIMKMKLNKMSLGAYKPKLGDFLESLGGGATINVDFNDGSEFTVVESEMPASPFVYLYITNTDEAPVLNVPKTVYKVYLVYNNTDYAVTIKAGTIGFAAPAGFKTIVFVGTMFIEIGNEVKLTAMQTLTNKTLTSPTINGGIINDPVISLAKHEGTSYVMHNFDEDNTWTVTGEEMKSDIIMLAGGTDALTVVLPNVPHDTKQFTLYNYSSQNALIKGEGEDVGITVAGGKTAILWELQNHVMRITADI